MTAIHGFTQEMIDDTYHLLMFLAGLEDLQEWEDHLFSELGLKLPVRDDSPNWNAFSQVVATTAFVPVGTTPWEYARGIITFKSGQKFHYARTLYEHLRELNR